MTSVVDNWMACPDLEVPPALTHRHEQWGCPLMTWWLYFSFYKNTSSSSEQQFFSCILLFPNSRVNPLYRCISEWIHYCCCSKRLATGIADVMCVHVCVCIWLKYRGNADKQELKLLKAFHWNLWNIVLTVQWLCVCVCVCGPVSKESTCVFLAVNHLCSPEIHSTAWCLCWDQPHAGCPAQEQKTSPTTYYSPTHSHVFVHART